MTALSARLERDPHRHRAGASLRRLADNLARLERAAAAGDPDAADRLERARALLARAVERREQGVRP